MDELRLYRRRRKKFSDVIRREIAEEVGERLGDFEGLLAFPVYGDAGLKVTEKVRNVALLVYGDCSMISMVKAFYRIVMRYDEENMTGRKEFVIKDRRGKETEGNWEIAK